MILGITGNCDKPEVIQMLPDLLQWLDSKQVDYYLETGLAKTAELTTPKIKVTNLQAFCAHCQMVISFGGDGTILATARDIGDRGIPILGVKIGGLGFLAELSPEELYTSLDDILLGNYRIVERMVLRVTPPGANEQDFFALNDIVLDKGAVSRVVRIRTFIDDEYLNTYIGDGLIISTPTGSTAYSLAAGGPILMPSMDGIIINPISPHSLAARPVVIPGDRTVRAEIEAAPNTVLLSADGQVSRALHTGESVVFQKADYRIKLVSYRKQSFYDVLRAKLNWGEDIRGQASFAKPQTGE